MEPKVSIIIPVYNGEKYILDSIQSIINQNYRNIEIVLINDASTDGSHLIISSINDPRIKYLINSKNVGVAESRNRGVLESSGELIAFLDHDDISLADRILMQVKEFENNSKLGLCGTDVQTIGDVIDHIWSYPVDSETLKSRLIFDCPFAAPSVMIRKKCLLDRGLKFKAAFPGVDDYEMWVQISKDWELKSIQKILTRYRIHQSQYSAQSTYRNDSSALIWLIQDGLLKKLGFSDAEIEKEIHLNIGSKWKFDFSDLDSKKAIQWLDKILIKNKKTNLYDKDRFISVLSERLNLIYKNIKNISYSTLLNYAFSRVGKSDRNHIAKTCRLALRFLNK